MHRLAIRLELDDQSPSRIAQPDLEGDIWAPLVLEGLRCAIDDL
jgi:hypothetical protein